MSNLATVQSSELFSVAADDAKHLTEKVIANNGDLAGLTEVERKVYYLAMCARFGLDAFSNPFNYLEQTSKRFNRETKQDEFFTRVTLYPNQRAADQLAKQQGITVQIKERSFDSGLAIAVAVAVSRGRQVEEVGAVEVGNRITKADAIMKASTKARRRAILALCGFAPDDDGESIRLRDPDVYDPPMDVAIDSGLIQQSASLEPAPTADFYQDKAEAIARHMMVLGWTQNQGKEYLKKNYKVRSRSQLSNDQLIEFESYLAGLVEQMQAEEVPDEEDLDE